MSIYVSQRPDPSLPMRRRWEFLWGYDLVPLSPETSSHFLIVKIASCDLLVSKMMLFISKDTLNFWKEKRHSGSKMDFLLEGSWAVINQSAWKKIYMLDMKLVFYATMSLYTIPQKYMDRIVSPATLACLHLVASPNLANRSYRLPFVCCILPYKSSTLARPFQACPSPHEILSA